MLVAQAVAYLGEDGHITRPAMVAAEVAGLNVPDRINGYRRHQGIKSTDSSVAMNAHCSRKHVFDLSSL
jgi:hypothetical protein